MLNDWEYGEDNEEDLFEDNFELHQTRGVCNCMRLWLIGVLEWVLRKIDAQRQDDEEICEMSKPQTPSVTETIEGPFDYMVPDPEFSDEDFDSYGGDLTQVHHPPNRRYITAHRSRMWPRRFTGQRAAIQYYTRQLGNGPIYYANTPNASLWYDCKEDLFELS